MWQTLIGAWPIDAERVSAYLVKATREAKLRTSWRRIDEDYERHLGESVREFLDDPASVAQLTELVTTLHPGFVANVLGQRAIQLLTPGIPDIYQGCETVSLRLVDPDNRVPPDDERLAALLRRALDEVPDPYDDLDAAKMRLTALGLRLRRDNPEVFDERRVLRAARVHGTAGRSTSSASCAAATVAVTATRFALGLAEAGGWDRLTTAALPEGQWRDLLTDRVFEGGPSVPVAQLHETWPVTLLERVS